MNKFLDLWNDADLGINNVENTRESVVVVRLLLLA
jgi:hypothetical protein